MALFVSAANGQQERQQSQQPLTHTRKAAYRTFSWGQALSLLPGGPAVTAAASAAAFATAQSAQSALRSQAASEQGALLREPKRQGVATSQDTNGSFGDRLIDAVMSDTLKAQLQLRPQQWWTQQHTSCSSCVSDGHRWCVGTPAFGVAEALLGSCITAAPTLQALRGVRAYRGEAAPQCFATLDECPALRLHWPGSPPPIMPNSVMMLKVNAEWDSSPMVDVVHKFVFCETPKVACSGFKRLFRRLSGHADYNVQEPWIHDPRQNGIIRLNDVGKDAAFEIMKDPAWTKAVFIRDPLERLLSAYLDKCREPVETRYDIHCPFAGSVSFADFVWHIVQEGQDHKKFASMDEHWRPQHLNCDLREWIPHYQFQGNFSHLHAHTKYLLQGLGLYEEYGRGWGPTGGELFAEDLEAHRTNASDAGEHLKYYTRELADMVARFYRKDYQLFALPMPQWYWQLA